MEAKQTSNQQSGEHMNTKQLTLEQGLKVQQNNLQSWKFKLSENCYQDLLLYTLKENSKLSKTSTGVDVVRGYLLSEFVENWKPSEN